MFPIALFVALGFVGGLALGLQIGKHRVSEEVEYEEAIEN